MNEPTHRILNGVRVDLTPKEIEEVKAQWALGRERMEVRKQEIEARKAKQSELLKRLGLTEEEAELLRERIK